jgi:hypothetical protein
MNENIKTTNASAGKTADTGTQGLFLVGSYEGYESVTYPGGQKGDYVWKERTQDEHAVMVRSGSGMPTLVKVVGKIEPAPQVGQVFSLRVEATAYAKTAGKATVTFGVKN